jgi:thiamine transport system permease protein
VLFYGRQGYLNVFLMSVSGFRDPPVTFLYSLAGVVIAHGFYNFPVIMRTVSQIWARLPQEQEEAALLLGASRRRVFLTITVPGLSAAILTGAVLVFLYCFFSFIIILLFGGIGGTTLEVELYQAARSLLDFRMAGTIALTETVAAFGIVFFYAWLQKRLSAGTAAVKIARERLPLRSAGERTAGILYGLFLVIFFIGPLFSVALRSVLLPGNGAYSAGFRFGLDAWVSLTGRTSFFQALGSTLFVAVAVAGIATLVALFFALAKMQGGKRQGPMRDRLLFRVLPFSPLAVSSVMLGFGWTLLFPRGNVAVLILAQSAMAWPFAWTQIQTALDRIPGNIPEAASLLSPGRLDTPFRVLIPLALKGILSGAGFVFAISAGDATLPLVLSVHGFENLSLLLYRLAGSYRFSEACACAVLLAVLCGFVFFMQETGFDT